MSPPNSRCNLSDCVMIWSKLKATTKIPVKLHCSFVIELVKKKKKQQRAANPGRQSSPFCHSMLGDFFVV